MRYLIVFVLAIGLWGCSSTQEQTSPALTEPQLSEIDLLDSEAKPQVAAPVATPPTSSIPAELQQALASGNSDRIKSVSQSILLGDAKNVPALNALAMSYYNSSQLNAATVLLDKAVGFSPRAPDVHNNIGVVRLARGDKSDAINSFRKALEINPDSYIAASNLSNIYIREKDFIKAIPVLSTFVNKGMADFDGRSNYAVALAATGKTSDAAAIYDKILQEKPDHKNAMLNYSILLIEKQQKYQEGLDLLNRLKFVGSANESRQLINDLEVKAKAGLK